MKKEKLTLEAIKQDLLTLVKFQLSIKSDWRFSYIIPLTLLAILLGLYLGFFIPSLVFAFSAYHIIRYIIEFIEYKSKKAAIRALIEQSDISISNEILSHIAYKTVYEPHFVVNRIKRTKTITVYYFNGGSSWRVPDLHNHYSWSNEFYISSKGLENMSIAGDEFYFVSPQSNHDIVYIYPRKIFELDASLKK